MNVRAGLVIATGFGCVVMPNASGWKQSDSAQLVEAP